MILPKPTSFRVRARIAIVVSDSPETRVLASTTYTLPELLEAFTSAIDRNEVVGFWSLPSGPKGVMELLCYPNPARIMFFAISEVSDLILVDKVPMSISPMKG